MRIDLHHVTLNKFYILRVYLLFLQCLSLYIEHFRDFFFQDGHVKYVVYYGIKTVPCNTSQYQYKFHLKGIILLKNAQ